MIKAYGRFIRTGSFAVAMLFVFMANGVSAKTVGAASETEAKTKAAETYGKLPLSFIQNDGQTDQKVKFYEKSAGHATFFTEEGVHISLSRATETEGKTQKGKSETPFAEKSRLSNLRSSLVKLIPLNANPSPLIIAEAPRGGKVNYFRGSDPKQWKANIPTYGVVVYKDLYQGIDMKFYGNNRQLEYDIIVSPGADPSQVKLSYEGIQGLKVTEAGDLEISLREGSIIQKRPYIYQEISGRKVEIDGRFVIPTLGRGGERGFPYGFEIASYNKDYPLIIDPVLVYSTYLGGVSEGRGIAVDGSGNAYVTGYTISDDFPTQNPIQGYGGYSDVFVTKINAAGNALVYSTYIGGSGWDNGYGIAVDGSGNAFVTGTTDSTDFPTQNPIQGHGGTSDAFVTKINAAGNALVYSTYLGGSDSEIGYGIAVDSQGNAYVTGYTISDDFPTQNPIQGVYGGGEVDAFVTKINSAGNELVYSTYLGGSDGDGGYGIAVNSQGNAYVTGTTDSTDFPIQNPIQGHGGTFDAFVTKINSAGNALAYSTYLGGNGEDRGYGIAVDNSGNAYVTGMTGSTDFPTQDPIQVANAGPIDVFVTKIDSAGNALVYSTYLGGSWEDYGYGIAVDGSGNAYVTGKTGSVDFPTQNPIQMHAVSWDAFMTKINSTGNALLYSTYIGGSDWDYGYGIAVDGSGNAYVTGGTYSNDFPTQYTFQGSGEGSCLGPGCAMGVFITKIGEQGPITGAIQFSADTYAGTEKGKKATITARRTGGSTGAVGVTYATNDGTATAGSDYTAKTGTLLWANGDTADKKFTVAIINDTIHEGNETFFVTLSNPTGGAVLRKHIAAVIITDNDKAPTVQFSAKSSSGSEATTPAAIIVTLSVASNLQANVNYATADGTATAGSDYTATSGRLTFNPGVTSQTIYVPITSDTTVGGNETFTVKLTSPVNATLGKRTTHTRTITNNDR